MKLYSWNVNGFRAVVAKPEWAWFEQCGADFIGLQETKAQREQIPEEHRDPAGLHSYWLAAERKGYSGVAVFSRVKPVAVRYELPQGEWQGEGRLIHLEYEKFHCMNVYFPNGQNGEERLRYKLGFYDAFLEYAQEQRKTKPIVVCGDFNTAHRPIDLARPKENEGTSGFLPIERAWLDKFTAAGYLDTFRLVNGDKPDQYSWWSFRMRARDRNVGWRIDYFFVSEELKGQVKNAWIEPEIKGSDHCPIGLELDL
ncbi:exodeoxyribonuclease III [Desulfovibrio sp. OttesenSCG-928-C14]|nr:exodeoxyribonuclease III [Desulfovibrio sp. OttesenSCG-928-C14]